ncbi:MAG: hypothetical protein AAF135_14835, partial [Bacteroidota bacterium]
MKTYLLSLLLFFSTPWVCAGVDPPAYMKWAGTDLDVGNVLTMKDNKYDLMTTTSQATWGFRNISCENELVFSLDPFALEMNITFDATLRTRITSYDAAGGTTSVDKTFYINYDPEQGTDYIEKSAHFFSDAYKVEVEILNLIFNYQSPDVTITETPDFLHLSSNIKVNRSYEIDRQQRIQFYPVSVDADRSKLLVEWAPVVGAEAYKLEWTYIDNYSHVDYTTDPNGVIVYKDLNKLPYDFDKHSVRVIVPHSFYEIDDVFPRGAVIFRVAPVGRSIEAPYKKYDGVWSLPSSYGLIGDLASPDFQNHRFDIGASHRPRLNWVYTASYVEDGKMGAGLEYADGSLRSRQSVSRFSQRETAYISETMYDHLGRGSLQVLPGSSESTQLDYVENFNQNLAGQKYSWRDFDVVQPGGSTTVATGMSDAQGASKYFSPNNPDKDKQEAYLPDAHDYPFAQTTFDRKGRVRTQGAAGPDFQVDGHATTNVFVTPSQEELDLVFGTDVGFADHYFKQLVTDPNGQMSLSITDLAGNVILTALDGDVPANLDELPGERPTDNLTLVLSDPVYNKLNNDGRGYSVNFTYYATVEGEHSLCYLIEDRNYIDSCLDSTLCLDCAYDLYLSIQDENGQEVLTGWPITRTIPPAGQIDSLCQNAADSVIALDFVLTEGLYTITKTLTLNEDYESQYLSWYTDPEKNTCIRTLSDFIDEYQAAIDFSGCGKSFCQSECEYQIGPIQDYFLANPGADTTDYLNAIQNCVDNCDPEDACDERLAILMEEVRPGAIFGGYTVDPGTGNMTHDAYSIFGGTQYPLFSTIPVFEDRYGQPILINGVPAQNVTAEEFINNFTDDMLDELVTLHPQYCIYDWCVDMRASDQFDRELLSYETFQDIPSTLVASPNPLLDILNADPYFQAGALGAADQATMNTYLTAPDAITVFTNTMSLLHYIRMLANCEPDLTLSPEDAAQEMINCLNSLPQDPDSCEVDGFWNIARGLYLSKKQSLIDQYVDDLPCLDAALVPPGYETQLPSLEDLTGVDMTQSDDDLFADFQNIVQTGLGEAYELTCEGYAVQWWEEISACGNVNLADSAAIIQALVDVCVAGSDDLHPFGSSTTKDGIPTAGGHTSFEDVLGDPMLFPNGPMEADPIQDPICNVFMLDFPRPYESVLNNIETLTYPKVDTCACDFILGMQETYYQQGDSLIDSVSFQAWLAAQTGTTVPNASGVACDCQDTYFALYGTSWTEAGSWSATANDVLKLTKSRVPADISCPQCATCQEVMGLWPTYDALISQGAFDMFANMMNRELDLNLTFIEYQDFYDTCVVKFTCPQTVAAQELTGLFNQLIQDGQWTSNNLDLLPTYPNGIYEGANCTDMTYQTQFGGNFQFQETMLDMVASVNQGLFMIGKDATDQFFVYKQSPQRIIEWKVQLNPSLTLQAEGIMLQSLSDGGIAVLGIFEDGTNPQKVGIIRLSETGTRQFSRTYDIEGVTGVPQDITGAEELSGGGMIFTFTHTSTNSPHSLSTQMIEIDNVGNLVNGSDPQFPELGYNTFRKDTRHPHFKQFVEDATGGYYMIGVSDSADGVQLLKLDNQLQVEWNRKIQPFQKFCDADSVTMSITPAYPSGVYVLLRHHVSTTTWDTYVMNISDTGGQLWSYLVNFSNELDGAEILNFESSNPGSTAGPLYLSGLRNLTGGGKEPFFMSLILGTDPEYIRIPNGGEDAKLVVQTFPKLDVLVGQEEVFAGSAATHWDITACQVEIGSWGTLTTQLTTNSEVYYRDLQKINTQNLATTVTPVADNTSLTCGPQTMVVNLDGDCVDCQTTLSMDAPTGVTFDDIELLTSTEILTDSTFQLWGMYTVGGVTDSVRLTGISDCLPFCDTASVKICANPLVPIVEVDLPSCEDELLAQAEYEAIRAYNDYLQDLSEDFLANYQRQCIDSVQETFTFTHPYNQRHHMMYFYDQAANLVQTVPPAGVDYLETTQLSAVKAAREANDGTSLTPDHKLRTQYAYDSFGNMTWQSTPDGGEARMWYDNLGRVVASQDARQLAAIPQRYSYIKYDGLGRSIEGGELTVTGGMQAVTVALARDTVGFRLWRDQGNTRRVTRTIYDFQPDAAIEALFPDGVQRELRGRVASTYFVDGEDDNRDFARHFSYDEHGHVIHMIQDYPSLEHLGYRYIHSESEFDLLSGNLHAMHLAPDDPEMAYTHRYEYDADNRLTRVMTQKAGETEEREAEYFYYNHGPLARVEIGAQNIQGMDYAYTLNGMLKGVNSDQLSISSDIGRDGRSNFLIAGTNLDNQNFVRDAFGYTLKYYAADANHEADYSSIGTGLVGVSNFEADGWQQAQDFRGLYNGNIGAMVTAFQETGGNLFPTQLYTYHHDQLNRLTQQRAYQGLNGNQWTVSTPLQDLATNYTYDANGNILSLFRNGNTANGDPLEMDSLRYRYKPNTNQLLWVHDAVDANNYSQATNGTEDFDNQDSTQQKYFYDEIGNLISDQIEGIEQIKWNVDGKIRGITFDPNGDPRPDLSFFYDVGGNRVTKVVKEDAT